LSYSVDICKCEASFVAIRSQISDIRFREQRQTEAWCHPGRKSSIVGILNKFEKEV
jgi:hypothetical protein